MAPLPLSCDTERLEVALRARLSRDLRYYAGLFLSTLPSTFFHNYTQSFTRKSGLLSRMTILCWKRHTWYNDLNSLGASVMSTQQLTVEEVAEELRVHPQTVRQWIREGELDAFDTGRGYRISRLDLDDFIQRRKTGKKRKHPDSR